MENKHKDNQMILFKVRDLRKKDQFKIDDKYLNGYARVCGVNATLVYSSLCRHAEFYTQKAFPSQLRIAYQHGISVKRVRAGFKKLMEYNIITAKKERLKGKFANYAYYLLDKSEWVTIGQNRPMVEPQVQNATRQNTVTVKPPTKDNKVYKDNKDKNKDNKEERKTLSPAEEMKSFLEGGKLAVEIAAKIIEKSGMPQITVVNELVNFRGYWTELNGTGKKQRWEMEKTFELKRRLGTWFRNANKFSNNKKKNIII